MPETPPHGNPLPSSTATALAAAAVVGIAVADGLTPQRLNLASLYVIPMVIAAAAVHRKLMWTVTGAAVVLTLALFPLMTHVDDTPVETRSFFLNRVVFCLMLLIIGAILHGFAGTYRKLERGREILQKRREELESANAELAAREEEIGSQNEELQSQAEELERQGEELRVVNEELERRERALDVLLSLSRELTAELSRDETMTRICRTLGELIDHGTAAAILLRHGDELKVECHQNFGDDGPEPGAIPFDHSFARLVLERNRTAFLEDLALRPELRVPQLRGSGEDGGGGGRRVQSILATPLRVNAHAVGTLEAYAFERRTWTDDQIALVESLAAQTSISLQAAELYERIDRERTRLEAVLDTVPFGVLISNADLTDVRINPAGAALRRVPPNTNIAPLGEAARWKLFSGSGTVIDSTNHPLARAIRNGETIHGQELEMVVDGGQQRYTMLYSAAPIHDARGAIIGGVCASVDITEQKRLQLELDARRREAEEASVRKTRFLAAVSHDIRTPANAISLLAELMQRTASTPAMAGEIPEIATDLRNSAMTLVNLVSDVLDLTRFDSGRVELEESQFPLEQLLSDECRQHAAVARDKGLEFHCDLPPGPIVIRADRVKLSRILSNLISNAVKFTQRGRVSVTAGASRGAGRGVAGGEAAGGGAWVRVTDTGPGIAPEYRERIFDEFFQLKHTSGISGGNSNHGGGSGLGLAICRRLADAMGGAIHVESEPGKGSTFVLTLPSSAVVPA
jgi:signal transduction histidine kinase